MIVFSKLKITGIIEVKTGLHIGGSDAFASIGTVNNPIIRDTLTKKPIIPGSSLKGKMRYLLVRARSESNVLNDANEDPDKILRLFGNSQVRKDETENSQETKTENTQETNNRQVINSRLKFSDCFILNDTKLKERADTITEVKFENTINRQTALATPRQMERVIKGAEFGLEIIYDVDNLSELEEDFKLIREGFSWIENDYLGGGGTRGSGRVIFKDLKVEKAYGEIEDKFIEKCNEILGEIG